MKTILNLSLCFFIVLWITGCDSKLDLSNPNKLTDSDFWKTETQFSSALTAVYPLLKNTNTGYYGRTGVRIRNTRGDEFLWRSNTPDIYTLHIFTNSNTNGVIQGIFSACYSGIYRTNLILQKIEETSFSDSFKNQIKGESYFLRGLFYFILAKEFGDVPIRAAASQDPSTFAIKKSPQADVYAQAIGDFTEAGKLLQQTAEVGRPTKGAAFAFLGKIHVYMENWQKAKDILEPLTKAPYTYKLVDDYEWNFDAEHENNEESIFEIPFEDLGGTSVWDDGEDTNSAQGTPVGMDYSAAAVGGWFNATISEQALNTLLMEKDKNGSIDYRVRMTAAWDYPGCMYYMKSFQEVFSGANISDAKLIWLLKYQNWQTMTAEDPTARSFINDRAFRFADVLLLLGEIENELGNQSQAINYINQIRERANLNPYSSTTDKMAVKDEIIHQRYVELFKEGERFYDLRRWGILKDAILKADPIRAKNLQEKHEYLPIPAKELQTNTLCEQNPLW